MDDPGREFLTGTRAERRSQRFTEKPLIGKRMIVLGIILILLVVFLDLPSILYTIGIILVVVGAVLWILGALGRAVGPRRHYW